MCGGAVLVAYGVVPCFQPISDFGRLYAVYGGFFILLSYVWGEDWERGWEWEQPDCYHVVARKRKNQKK